MKSLKIFILLQFLTLIGSAQHLPAYQIFDEKGKKTSYKKMLKQVKKSDIFLFGELHDNAIAHWLQLELIKNAYSHNENLLLGAEMMEADNQASLNEFLEGKMDQKGLDSTARLWPNYKTDYAPLVNFAKENEIPFIATNVPRRYANLVYKNGFTALDSLSKEEKEWIVPLPFPFDSELPTYKNILAMMGDHGSEKLVMAQALKDATMAHFILKNYKEGHLFIHFNGAYHSDFYEGILWYLQQEKPMLNYLTISTVTQNNLSKLEEEHVGKAHFIICVDADMTSTY
ncbi:ChaN family lipoprotein [Marivirga sp. S37H4]|uniref:ChaN family lipoprotein n=1 Tax=Marivirga aurantiaca TaxID=2802615 RepID=A0A935C9F2_9BACT|nr:ChaN family lipoprotein [Marivirga aurantiaca]MBK6265557.1 ChaN family lipoprotein [Marivirga aurantiaca]